MACSTGCTNGPHETWGACVRAKSLQIADVQAHQFNSGQHRAIKQYVNAREAGLQPDGVSRKQVAQAWKATEATGTPYRGDA